MPAFQGGPMTNGLKSATAVVLGGSLAVGFVVLTDIDAADHRDGPIVSLDLGADINDVYVFLDPNDNSRLVIAGVIGSALSPDEGADAAFFDEGVRYAFNLELTGDADPDAAITLRFSAPTPMLRGPGGQTAIITLPSGVIISAPTTPATLDATPPPAVITTDPATGVAFFAGLRDNPFFFDVPAESQYSTAMRRCVTANPSAPDGACTQAALAELQRGKDSFAGGNVPVFALSLP